MTRVALLSLLVAFSAFAAKPRGSREELVEPVATPVAAQDPITVFSADLGVGVWSSSLVGVGGLDLAVGVGRRITRHLVLSGELGVGLSAWPTTGFGVLVRVSLSGVLAWDVAELLRAGGRTLPFELGPELGLGTAVFGWTSFALPLVQVGAFGRYVFSPSMSLGLRLRAHLPFWTNAPSAFTGGRFIGAAALEPAGFTATASLLHTF
ncbi:MAG: hypothetical protein Q8N26_04055 [Myxococcales bacterium]|nr:hypothetical protein [Myxococcales bacterium]